MRRFLCRISRFQTSHHPFQSRERGCSCVRVCGCISLSAMSNDLERAVLCQFDPSPDAAQRKVDTTPFVDGTFAERPVSLQAEAAVYCAQLLANPRWWELFVEHYNATSYIEVKFWCLNALQEVHLWPDSVIRYSSCTGDSKTVRHTRSLSQRNGACLFKKCD